MKQPSEYVSSILAAADEFRIADYERLAADAREGLSPATLIEEVFSPVLRAAGDRWEQGRFSVVQEHLLTAAVRRQLAYSLDIYNRAATGPSLAFTTLSGERHEMGSLMLALIAATRGFRAIYLGPDLPVLEIGRFCRRVAVEAVAVSIVTSPEVIDVSRQLQELRDTLPHAIGIWIGGHAALQLPADRLPPNSMLIRDVTEFERRLVRHGPA